MKYSNFLMEVILQETYKLLTEISLENLGFPQEIIERIFAIPDPSVKSKIEKQQFKKYIDWIGTTIKSMPLGFTGNTPFSLQVSRLSDSIDSLRTTIADEYQDLPEESKKRLEQVLSSLAARIPQDQKDGDIPLKMSLPDLLALRTNLSSFFDKFLPKIGIEAPDIRGELSQQMTATIDSFFETIKEKGVFSNSDEALAGGSGFQFFEKEIESLAVEEGSTPVETLSDLTTYISNKVKSYREELEDPSGILKIEGMPKGYFWFSIGKNECEIEGKRMGHCGRDRSGKLYSLRKSAGEGSISTSHVTIAYNEEDKFVYQIKGKQNDAPIEKYWPMIVLFFKHMGVKKTLEKGDHTGKQEAFQELNKYLNSKFPNISTDIMTYVEEQLEEIANSINEATPKEQEQLEVSETKIFEEDINVFRIYTPISYSFRIPKEAFGRANPEKKADKIEELLNDIVLDKIDNIYRQVDVNLLQWDSKPGSFYIKSSGDNEYIGTYVVPNSLRVDRTMIEGSGFGKTMRLAQQYKEATIGLINDDNLPTIFEAAVESLYQNKGPLKRPEPRSTVAEGRIIRIRLK